MRSLLESSWMKFGPAGRDSLDWSPGPSALPSGQAAGQSSGEAIISAGSITAIAVATVSLLLLLLFSGLGLLMWRRRRGLSFNSKLGLANVIALEDLQDPERNCELLSSIRRSQRHRVPSSSSEQDPSDGVFLMVYLPSPYEHTLTRIARAASTSSSHELLPPSPGPETGGRDEEDGTKPSDEIKAR